MNRLCSRLVAPALVKFRRVAWFLPLCCALLVASAQADDLLRRTQLGVGIAPLTAEERSAFAAKDIPIGALKITAVSPIFTAAKAGIKTGDVLLTINREALRPQMEMQLWVSQQKPGAKVSFELLRDGKPLTLETTWIERPREPDNEQYKVRYESVVSRGHRMRTVVTIPAALKAGARAPAMLLIPGVALGTLDVSLKNADPYSQIVRSFATRGYVTMRVEVPGIGDSEDGPALKTDFLRQADIYAQGLKALAARSDVDPKRLVVFGHSMGGLWAPLAVENTPVKAVIVGGTVFRTWYEYVIENSRRQIALGGATLAELDDEMRKIAFIQQRYLNEKLTPEQILTADPTLKKLLDDDFKPPGVHMGRVHGFWHQVGALNLPAAWEKALANRDTKLLAFWGTSEFVASEIDHRMLVDWVNSQRPQSATYKPLPNSDHGFNQTASAAESHARWGKPGGTFNANIVDTMHQWLSEIQL